MPCHAFGLAGELSNSAMGPGPDRLKCGKCVEYLLVLSMIASIVLKLVDM
jgi:hypothetical protein